MFEQQSSIEYGFITTILKPLLEGIYLQATSSDVHRAYGFPQTEIMISLDDAISIKAKQGITAQFERAEHLFLGICDGHGILRGDFEALKVLLRN